MKRFALVASAIALLCACTPPPPGSRDGSGAPHVAAADKIAAGKYLVEIGGCNDCHTPGFPESGGKTPESEWLIGVPVGYRGPWGTSYAMNLRLSVQDTPEDAWVATMKAREALPPMPWPSLHAMSEQDLRATYAYIKSLPVKGERMPAPLPPTEEPKTPYYWFMPITGPAPGSE
jgi:mono/diheme cytochrome c family protein